MSSPAKKPPVYYKGCTFFATYFTTTGKTEGYKARFIEHGVDNPREFFQWIGEIAHKESAVITSCQIIQPIITKQ